MSWKALRMTCSQQLLTHNVQRPVHHMHLSSPFHPSTSSEQPITVSSLQHHNPQFWKHLHSFFSRTLCVYSAITHSFERIFRDLSHAHCVCVYVQCPNSHVLTQALSRAALYTQMFSTSNCFFAASNTSISTTNRHHCPTVNSNLQVNWCLPSSFPPSSIPPPPPYTGSWSRPSSILDATIPASDKSCRFLAWLPAGRSPLSLLCLMCGFKPAPATSSFSRLSCSTSTPPHLWSSVPWHASRWSLFGEPRVRGARRTDSDSGIKLTYTSSVWWLLADEILEEGNSKLPWCSCECLVVYALVCAS